MFRGICRVGGLAVVLVWSSMVSADLPSAYDLRDVNGQQYVSTRIDDQIGPGPCWAFSTMTAVESSVRIRGLWDGAANDLNLSEQFLRANETTGTKELSNSELVDSPGYTRKVNSGGNEWIGISHMARLHGPLYESQCPFEYKGNFYDSKPYYDPDHYYDRYGTTYADWHYPLWPNARPYPAEYTSDARGAYFLRKAYDVSGIDAIKQKVMGVGAPYVSIQHEFNAYDPDTNTYYDDGTVEGEGLGAHGVNILGWDDSKFVPGAPNLGAWLIKHSHEVDENDPLYPDRAGEAPTYFWVSYDTSIDRFTDHGDVTFFEMGSAEDIQSAYFHDYTGNLNNSSVYLPDNAQGSGEADASVSAQVFQVGSEGDEIGIVSFYTRKDNQPFEVRIYDSLAALSAGADPLSQMSGIADVEGYHAIDLEETVTVAANDDFVLFLEFTDGEDQLLAYNRDGTGSSGTYEYIQNDWCYYYDTTDQQWEDLADYWDGMAFTTKAYGIVPEPTTLAILAVGGLLSVRRRRR